MVPTGKKPTLFEEIESKTSPIFESKKQSFYYEINNDVLIDSERKKLIEEIQKTDLLGISQIKIVGYTDNTHSSEFNKLLSNRRSKNMLKVIQQIITDADVQYTAEGKGVNLDKISSLVRRVDVVVKFKNTEVAS